MFGAQWCGRSEGVVAPCRSQGRVKPCRGGKEREEGIERFREEDMGGIEYEREGGV